MARYGLVVQPTPLIDIEDEPFIFGFQADGALVLSGRRNFPGSPGSDSTSYSFGATDGTDQQATGFEIRDNTASTVVYRSRVTSRVLGTAGTFTADEVEAALHAITSTAVELDFSSDLAQPLSNAALLAMEGVDFDVHTLDVATSGSTVTKSDLSFQPKLLIVHCTGQATAAEDRLLGSLQLSWGATDGTSEWCNCVMALNSATASNSGRSRTVFHTDRVCSVLGGDGLEKAAVSFSSFESDGYVLTIDANPAATWQIQVIAIGGDAFECAVGYDETPTSDGDDELAGFSFDPEAGVFLVTQNTAAQDGSAQADVSFSMGMVQNDTRAQWGWYDKDAANPTECVLAFEDQKLVQLLTTGNATLVEADISGWGTGSVAVDWTKTDATARRYGYVLFGGEPPSTPTDAPVLDTSLTFPAPTSLHDRVTNVPSF